MKFQRNFEQLGIILGLKVGKCIVGCLAIDRNRSVVRKCMGESKLLYYVICVIVKEQV